MNNYEYAKKKLLSAKCRSDRGEIELYSEILSSILDLQEKQDLLRIEYESQNEELVKQIRDIKSKCKHEYYEYENAAYDSGYYCSVCGKRVRINDN
jgi:hypothetical protein